MKRIFSKKSGFTLVEIIVAFAIFAIMSTMILSMVQLTVRQRNMNSQFAGTIQDDSEYLVSHYIDNDDKYATKEGEFVLNFSDKNIKASIDYQMRANEAYTNEAEGINYFVGNTAYRKGNDLKDPEANAKGGSGAGQDARYSTWIKGSRGLGAVNICGVVAAPKPQTEEDKSKPSFYKGPGYCYLIKCSADGDDTEPEYADYLQYSLSFKMPGTTPVKRLESDGELYMVEIPKLANIIDYGVITSGTLEWNDGTCKGVNEVNPGYQGRNNFLIQQSSMNTIHIKTTLKNALKTFSGTEYVWLWVVFDQDPGLSITSFGDNYVLENGAAVYRNYPMVDKDGDVNGSEANIYGAHALVKTKID